MFKNRSLITGRIKAIVWEWTYAGMEELRKLQEKYGPEYKKSNEYTLERLQLRERYAQIKLFPQSRWRKLFRMNPIPMVSVHHNIVTNEGDAMIADLMQETPERAKVNNASGVIGVGTGYVSELKTTDALVTQTGSNEAMDATYPQTKGAWAAADDNVIVYKATFEAGDLNASGIDEALLGNGTDTMAYAQINPAVNVTAADTLEITWEITLLGA